MSSLQTPCEDSSGERLLSKTLVCGVGNKLKKDDGLGPYVIEQLAKRRMPSNVHLLDCGICGFKAALRLGEYEKVIFIDAIRSCGPVGKIYRFDLNMKGASKNSPLSHFKISLHESDLMRILGTAILLNAYPQEVVVLGCEPGDLSFGLGLSIKVENAVKKITQLVLDDIL